MCVTIPILANAAPMTSPANLPATFPGGDTPVLLQRIAGVCILLASALLLVSAINPDHFPPWTSFHSEAPAFAAGAVLLLACMARGTRLGAPALVVALLIASAWFQWAAGLVRYAGDAWVVTAYIVAFAAAWFWSAGHEKTPGHPEPLDLVVALLMVMGLLTAAQAIAQWLQLEQHFPAWLYSPPYARSTANLGQPNQAATLLLMALAAGGVLLVRRRIGLAGAWAWFLVGGWAVVLTQSRTALVSATVMVTVFVSLSTTRPTLRAYRFHAIAWLVALLTGSWLLQALHLDSARGGMGKEVMTSVGLRPVLWRQLLAGVGERPWTGYGWLQVGEAQQAGSAHVAGIEQVNYSHNIVLDAFVMLGIPVCLLLLGVCFIWLRNRWHRRTLDDGAATAAAFMLVPLLVHSMLELPHAYSYFLVPGGILFGIIGARTRDPQASTVALPRAALGALALAVLGMLTALGVEYASIEEDFRVNRFENRRLGYTPTDYVVPQPVLLTQFDGLLKAMRLRAVRGMKSEDVQTLVTASHRYTWAPLQFRAALTLGLNGHPEEARRHLVVIKAMFHPSIYEEGRTNWLEQQQQYPELQAVTPP